MGMTIDNSILNLEDVLGELRSSVEIDEELRESCGKAINIMRKYQKIQAIAEKCNLKLLPKEAMSTFMRDVLEVLEDGNDD